jgi:hypothetical protein
MTSYSVDDRPDTHEMVVIHRIFRRGFAVLADVADRVPSGDTARARAVAAHAEFLLNGLHHHRAAEDTDLWPRLAERAEPDALLVARMSDQQEAVALHIAAIRRLFSRWRSAPGGPELADGLRGLGDAPDPHLDEEEAHILPLARIHVIAPEWQQFGDAAFAGFTNDEKLLAVGHMLDVATAGEAAAFLRKLPLPVRLIWHLAGRRRYARHMSAVLGTQR